MEENTKIKLECDEYGNYEIREEFNFTGEDPELEIKEEIEDFEQECEVDIGKVKGEKIFVWNSFDEEGSSTVEENKWHCSATLGMNVEGEKTSSYQLCGNNSSKNMRTHTGEKPFKCDFCDASFTRSSNMVAHMKIHSGKSKMFICKLCGAKFTHAFRLKIHMRAHTGENLRKCVMCNAKFANPAILTKHIRKAHPID